MIVDDEPPARDNLAAAIRAAAPEAVVAATASSVIESVAWLAAHPAPDLLFLDIQLSDGLSFEIFRRTTVSCPVVFATAYDDYLLEAFHANGIDYLLKPIRAERVAEAIDKYRRLKSHFNYSGLLDSLEKPKTFRRERFLVRKGIDFVSVPVREIAYFFSSHKLVFLTTCAGQRFVLDRPLAELEEQLDPARFFRANRNLLASIESIARVSPYGKGKLRLELKPKLDDEMIVSQERAAAFRQWLGES